MPTEHNTADSPGARLRRLMDGHCVALPGAFNGLVGRAVADAGFDAAYVSGAAVSASAGVPDVGLVTLDGFSRVIKEVAVSSGLPVLADADTGFGEAEMVTRTVYEYAGAGAAGFHIEDQVFPKRCGHLSGKQLVPIDHFQEKLAAASKARDAIDAAQTPGGAGISPSDSSGTDVSPVRPRGSFIVCARTDARGVEGLDSAIERAKAYVDAGAEMVFPEGLTSEEDFAKFAEALRGHPMPEPAAARPQTSDRSRPAASAANSSGGNPHPKSGSKKSGPYLLANMTEFGKTPILPVSRFAHLGYDCVIFPVTTLRVAMGAVTRALAELRASGSAETLLEQMQSRSELYRLLGYTPGAEWAYPSPTKPEHTSQMGDSP